MTPPCRTGERWIGGSLLRCQYPASAVAFGSSAWCRSWRAPLGGSAAVADRPLEDVRREVVRTARYGHMPDWFMTWSENSVGGACEIYADTRRGGRRWRARACCRGRALAHRGGSAA